MTVSAPSVPTGPSSPTGSMPTACDEGGRRRAWTPRQQLRLSERETVRSHSRVSDCRSCCRQWRQYDDEKSTLGPSSIDAASPSRFSQDLAWRLQRWTTSINCGPARQVRWYCWCDTAFYTQRAASSTCPPAETFRMQISMRAPRCVFVGYEADKHKADRLWDIRAKAIIDRIAVCTSGKMSAGRARLLDEGQHQSSGRFGDT